MVSKIIAVDFDGVIHDHKHPIEGRKMGGAIEGAKESLIYLKSRGYKIIIFTVWGGTEQGKKTISDFMKFYGLRFDEITNEKPKADFYLDDHGLKFTSWKQALEDIKNGI